VSQDRSSVSFEVVLSEGLLLEFSPRDLLGIAEELLLEPRPVWASVLRCAEVGLGDVLVAARGAREPRDQEVQIFLERWLAWHRGGQEGVEPRC
jgi:hypothetical protein